MKIIVLVQKFLPDFLDRNFLLRCDGHCQSCKTLLVVLHGIDKLNLFANICIIHTSQIVSANQKVFRLPKAKGYTFDKKEKALYFL